MKNIEEEDKKHSFASQSYLEKLKNSGIDWRDSDDSFYDEGIMVTNIDDELLLETDILVHSDAVERLLEFIQEYVDTEDIEDAKYVIRVMLSIFFDVDMGAIDSEFLSSNDTNDLWDIVVGNKDVADKLIPDLFKDNPMYFKDIIEQLEYVEEDFLTNCQNISKVLDEQIQRGDGLFVQSVDPNSGLPNNFYWLDSNDLQLFRGIEWCQCKDIDGNIQNFQNQTDCEDESFEWICD